MNARNIVTVYLKELKDSLRDRRTLLSMIIIPTFIVPALAFTVGRIGSQAIARARDETAVVMLLGGEDSPGVVTALKADPKLKVLPATADWREQISDKKIRAAVQLPERFEYGLATGAAPAVVVYNYDGELKSSLAATELEKFFRELRDKTAAGYLAERSLPARLLRPFETRRENVAAPEKVGGNMIGSFVPYLIIMLCFSGALYPAIDLTAGEKERGTMETLLCCPVNRVDIVLGKFLMVLTSSLSAMTLSLLSTALTVLGVGVATAGAARGAQVAAAKAQAAGVTIPLIDPAGVLGVLAMVLPVAVFFSALLLTVALFAKSAKEAQTYITPLAFVVILPVVVGILPGIELNARLALVPLLNLSLVCKEMLSGVWHWHYIALIFGSSCVYAAVALAFAVRMFNREDVIFRT